MLLSTWMDASFSNLYFVKPVAVLDNLLNSVLRFLHCITGVTQVKRKRLKYAYHTERALALIVCADCSFVYGSSSRTLTFPLGSIWMKLTQKPSFIQMKWNFLYPILQLVMGKPQKWDYSWPVGRWQEWMTIVWIYFLSSGYSCETLPFWSL